MTELVALSYPPFLFCDRNLSTFLGRSMTGQPQRRIHQKAQTQPDIQHGYGQFQRSQYMTSPQSYGRNTRTSTRRTYPLTWLPPVDKEGVLRGINDSQALNSKPKQYNYRR